MDITFQEEKISDLLADPLSEAIFRCHWKELANNQAEKPLDIDKDSYIALSEKGIVRALTVRDVGQLVGYIVFVVNNHLHYKENKYAVCDVYYIVPEWRGKGVGKKLFQEAFKWLKDINVNYVVVQEKINHPHAELLTTMGMKLVENVYEMRI